MKAMNKQEYDQQKRECWEEFCQHIVDEEEAFYNMFDRAYALGKQEKDVEETPITERLYEEEKSQLECLYYYLNRAADKQENESVSVAILFETMERLEDMFGVDLLTNGHGKTKPKDADTVIQGWVCRDKVRNEPFTSDLFIVLEKPTRVEEWGKWCDCGDYIELDSTLFPDLTWDDEPEQIEIILKRKKNG